jgi:hypothetical protein
MTWDAFLNHPTIVTYHQQADPGQYLFLKAIHEIVVGCFAYQQWTHVLEQASTKMAASESDKRAIHSLTMPPIRSWYDMWLPHVSRWRIDLLDLQARYSGQIEPDTINWPAQISALADVINEITNLSDEAHALTVPENEQTRILLDALWASIGRIQLIHQAIRKHEYIRIYEYPHTDTER